MIKKDSKEWENFILQIEYIKQKSNRQVLCAKCWLILNYEQKIKHLKENYDHESSILTSAKFASAAQIISLAQACNKLVCKPDGQYIISPFHGISRHIMDTADTPEMQNNSNSSLPMQGSSRSDSQNGNSESLSDQRPLQERVNKIENNIDKIQNILQIFVQTLQNTNNLQQKIFEFMNVGQNQKEVPLAEAVPEETSFRNNNNNYQPNLEQTQQTLLMNRSILGLSMIEQMLKQVEPKNNNDKIVPAISRDDPSQKMTAAHSNILFSQNKETRRYTESDSEEQGEFNPFKLFHEKQQVRDTYEEDDGSPVAKMTADQFFSLMEFPEKMAGRKRDHQDRESENSIDNSEKEIIDNQTLKMRKK